MDSVTRRFKQEGITEEYARKVLLPATGFLDYSGPIRLEVTLLPKGLGIDSALYRLAVYANGGSKKLRGFVIKDHLHQREGAMDLYREEVRPERRYRTEKQILQNIGRPRLIATNATRKRLVMEEWDGSLDELLTETHHAYKSTEEKARQRIKEAALSYVQKAIITSLRVNAQLTQDLPELKQTTEPPELKPAANRKYKLGLQVRKIIERSVRSKPKEEQDKIREDAWKRFIKGGKLNDELLALGGYLARGGTLIQYDARSSNVLFAREPGAVSSVPSADYISFAPCDYAEIREGPWSFDIASLANDQYGLYFGFTLEERLKLFMRGCVEMPGIFKGTSSASMDELCRKEFCIASTAALIKCAANPIAVEEQDPERFREYLKSHPIEDNRENCMRNLAAITELLKGTPYFAELERILTEARVRLIDEQKEERGSSSAVSLKG